MLIWCLNKAWGSFFHSPQHNVKKKKQPTTTMSMSSVCGAAKLTKREKTPHFWVWCIAVPVCHQRSVGKFPSASAQSCHNDVRDCSSSAEEEMCASYVFKGAHCCHQIRSCCLGPEPWDFDEMLRQPKWHKLHAVIIPQMNVKPGLGILRLGQ